jgi:hypothetical protein
LKEWVSDMLSADTVRRRGLFDAKAVTALVEDDRAGRVDAAYTILGLVCIEVWCRKFFDEPVTRFSAAELATNVRMASRGAVDGKNVLLESGKR